MSEPIAFQQADRVLTSLLAAREKRLLVWMAARVPAWITSDHLTGLGFLSMALAGLSYWLASRTPFGLVLVVVCLAGNWLGDSLDGTLARVRDCQRPRYGYYVDHVLDALGALFLLAGLAASGYMTPILAAGLLAAFYLMSIEVYLATCALGTFRISFWRLGPTELRIVLAIGTLALIAHPLVDVGGHPVLLFDIGAVIAIGGLVATFLVAAIANIRALYRAEPLPRPAAAPAAAGRGERHFAAAGCPHA